MMIACVRELNAFASSSGSKVQFSPRNGTYRGVTPAMTMFGT